MEEQAQQATTARSRRQKKEAKPAEEEKAEETASSRPQRQRRAPKRLEEEEAERKAEAQQKAKAKAKAGSRKRKATASKKKAAAESKDAEEDGGDDGNKAKKKRTGNVSAMNVVCPENLDMAEAFENLSYVQFQKGNRVAGISFARVAKTIREFPEPIESPDQLEGTPGFGKSAYYRMREFMEVGYFECVR